MKHIKLRDDILDSMRKSQSIIEQMKHGIELNNYANNAIAQNICNQIIRNIDQAKISALDQILEGDDDVCANVNINPNDSIQEQLGKIQEMVQALASRASQTKDSNKRFIGLVILIYFITQVVIPQLNSLAVNLYTPYVQKYFGLVSDTNRSDSVLVINQLINDSRFRYVSVDGLNLRIGPTNKAKILHTLSRGTLVVVLEKRKSWIKVETTINDCKIQGWAYTRYVKRFK